MTHRAGQERALPEHLREAYGWIESADEWDAALSDPAYAPAAAANARESHDCGETITEEDLSAVIEWVREYGSRPAGAV